MLNVERIEILGVGVDALRLDEMLECLHTAAAGPGRALIAHVNLHAIPLAAQQPWLGLFYQACDLVFCDGMGVMLAARLLGRQLPQRFTLADWIEPLAMLAAAHGLRLYFVGSAPGVAERAAQRLGQRHAGLQVVGTQPGFFNQRAGPENDAVVAQINDLAPHILLVGLGMPLQEKWLAENWPHLNVNVALTCGALFEYLAGDLRRGPRWMTEHYLEWLARMWISPRRYTRRYVYDIAWVAYHLARQRWIRMGTQTGQRIF